MCKFVLIALIVVLVALMVVSALVVQEYGWIGFLMMLGVLLVLAWIAKRTLPRLLRHLMMRPLRQMGAVMHNATVVVHSVNPTDAPPPDDLDDDEHAIEDDDLPDEDDDDDWEEEEPDTDVNPGSLDWYFVDFSVTPRDAGTCEGRVANRRGWSPDMVSAVAVDSHGGSLNPFQGWPPDVDWTDLGTVQSELVEIWDGSAFVAPIEMVFGEQRLRLRVGVARRVQVVKLVYAHYTEIGEVAIPRIDIRPESQS
jgi:hypothetical protein